MADGWKNDNGKTILSWIATIAMLGIAWPIGLFMLFRVLSTGSLFSPRRRISQSGPIDVKATVVGESPKPSPRPESRVSQTRPAAQRLVPVKRKKGRGLMIGGGIVSGVFALALLSEIADVLAFGWKNYMLRGLFTLTGFFAAGLVMLGFGVRSRRQATRYRRYLTLIGNRRTLSIDALAKALPVPFSRACDDLQDMLERGHLPPEGYIDLQNHRLVLSPALEDEPPAPRTAPAPPPKGDDAVLAEIRSINDEIDDPVMSAKIDRIGEITARILDYQRRNPAATNELQSFLDYYLPTTLKLLRSYERMEEQGVEGENIRAAKARIEDAMDKVVEGFETRLDKLFEADAIDVTSDIQVLEQMLRKDGLSEDGLLKF